MCFLSYFSTSKFCFLHKLNQNYATKIVQITYRLVIERKVTDLHQARRKDCFMLCPIIRKNNLHSYDCDQFINTLARVYASSICV